jgi:Holliday junction resolvase RusA-like endonuclease
MVSLNIKPLSVNQCWQGKRFKTQKYLKYELDLIYLLPKITMPQPPYKIYITFGMSNILSDWDNPVKPFQDILQKKYNFNDKDIMEAHIYKKKVKKGEEFINFSIEQIDLF